MNKTMWGWVIRGLGGVVEMVAMLRRDKAPITVFFLGELQKITDKLNELTIEAAQDVEDA